MGKSEAAQPAKLIVSIIYRQKTLLAEAFSAIVHCWGAADILSESLAFDYTDYYRAEMGANLRRRIVSVQHMIDPGDLATIKRKTNDIEKALSAATWPNRQVNIDPGYLNASHLILASTKPAPHRPYLQQGIYADLTMVFQNMTFKPFFWTYPDYQSEKMIAILRTIRQKYLFQRKHKPLEQGAVGPWER